MALGSRRLQNQPGFALTAPSRPESVLEGKREECVCVCVGGALRVWETERRRVSGLGVRGWGGFRSSGRLPGSAADGQKSDRRPEPREPVEGKEETFSFIRGAHARVPAWGRPGSPRRETRSPALASWGVRPGGRCKRGNAQPPRSRAECRCGERRHTSRPLRRRPMLPDVLPWPNSPAASLLPGGRHPATWG